jgi:drug/metabolite transporter (DMT)-like permease
MPAAQDRYNRSMTGEARTRSAYLPFAALALLAFIWGYNWVVMKVGVGYSDPFTFSALRNLLGALALFVIVALRRGPFRPRPFWLLTLFALFQTSMSGVSVWALYLGSAGKTSYSISVSRRIFSPSASASRMVYLLR